ncbi:MAG: M23 family metallopeptidase [Elusimicrobia bacterium]|nr:M23 family metallopeptidase [Elusimicrobiota bacterium]
MTGARLAAMLMLLSPSADAGKSKALKELEQVAEQTARRTVESEFDRYVKQAAVLKKHRDSGGDADVRGMLQLLDSAGVIGSIQSGRGFGQGFRPFKVRNYKGLWRWPLRAGIVSSEYGRRWGRRHDGLDIAADEGVPVMAAADGTVLYAGDKLRGYGNVVILRHDQKTTSLYAHNRRLMVKEGDSVRAGQQIALLGSTGHSTGPHVHFEIRKAGKAVNPRTILVKSRF